MTNDERLNKIEDQIMKISETIRHNNGVSRKVVTQLQTKVQELSKEIEILKTQMTASNVGLGDIFNSSRFGVKR